ncbi:LOW QUALITY PROTEIN: nucleolar transcription factor 1-like, partial [Menidia menidia]
VDPDWPGRQKGPRLPEPPRTAEETWQQSVGGEFQTKYRSDRRRALAAMEAAWRSMEKKEKIPWIKKAAEDQKRYERELLDMRGPVGGQRKPKFDGEPKKPPVSGYQMFSQELLTNGELNHFSLKERMVEIGKRWQKLSQAQKDRYRGLVEDLQQDYRAQLEAWTKSLSPQDRAVYKEFSSSKRRGGAKPRSSPVAKVRVTAKAKGGGAKAAAPGIAVGKRAMAYRAKQDVSESEEEEKSGSSSDSEEEETTGSSESEDENDEDEEEDDEDQSSSEDSSESDSD